MLVVDPTGAIPVGLKASGVLAFTAFVYACGESGTGLHDGALGAVALLHEDVNEWAGVQYGVLRGWPTRPEEGECFSPPAVKRAW